MRKARVFAVLVLSLAGCATFKPADINPQTGEFPSLAAVGSDDIEIDKPLPGVKTLAFVYVRTFSQIAPAKFSAFVEGSLSKIGFPKVVFEPDLTQFVIKNGLNSEIQNLNTVLALNRLSQVTGPFLVAEFRMFGVPGGWCRFEAVLVDPVTGETVFAASHHHMVLLDFDKEVSYPMMNIIKRWFDKSAAMPTAKPSGAKPRLSI